MGIWKWSIGLVLAGTLAFAAIGCGDDDDDGDGGGSDNTPVAAGSPTAAAGDDDEAAVEKALRDAVAAWNAKDVNALIALFSDEGLASSFGEGGETREEIVGFLPEFIGDPPIEIRELNTEASEASATTEVTWEIGRALEKVQFSLVIEAGAWKIDREENLVVEIPDGVTTVNVDLNEFAFALIASDIPANGAVAFKANNVGQQQHEIGLARIPADADIQELLMSEEDVPGFEFLGSAGPIEPGDDGALVLVEPLEPGRYTLVCFLPDTAEGSDGEPHAFKGMVEEFTIAAQ